jgi:nitrogen fixation protein FixH
VTGRTTTKSRRSRWIPWLFVGGFGIIIAANGIMAFFAFDSWTGLSADDPYKRGLDHNNLQAEVLKQRQLGWGIAVGQKELGNRRTRLRLQLTNRQKAQVTWAKVEVLFYRPVSRGADFKGRLVHVGGGAYEATITFPQPGLWEARYRIVTRAHTLKATQRFKVR